MDSRMFDKFYSHFTFSIQFRSILISRPWRPLRSRLYILRIPSSLRETRRRNASFQRRRLAGWLALPTTWVSVYRKLTK